jgi:hypothetical protein
VADLGHDGGAVGDPDLGEVFAERHNAHPMKLVLDGPVAADGRGGLVRPGSVPGEGCHPWDAFDLVDHGRLVPLDPQGPLQDLVKVVF